MKPLLIIKTGAALPSIGRQYGEFEDFILRQLAMDARKCLVVPVFQRQRLPAVKEVAGVVITGSHAMVTDRAPWSEYVADWLRRIPPGALPVLGICYGHQLLAQAFGGEVGYHPQGLEIGSVPIELTEAGRADPLLGCLPSSFSGYALHAQTVYRLPAGAAQLAKNSFEQYHAFRLRENMWGVQFHPEFSAEITRAYIEAQKHELAQAGYDVVRLKEQVRGQRYGEMLLKRFLALVKACGDSIRSK